MNSTTEADAAESEKCVTARSKQGTVFATFAVCFQQAAGAVADRGGVFHGVARHHDSKYRGADDRGGAPRCSAQHEVGAGKLHAEPRGISFRSADGWPIGSARAGCSPPRSEFSRWDHFSAAYRATFIAGRVPHSAGLRRIDDGARRPAHGRADVRQIGTGSRDELRRDPRFDRSDAGADRWRPDRRILPLAGDFLREYSDWPRRIDDGLPALAGLSRRTHRSSRCGRADSFRLGRRVAFVRAGSVRRAHTERARNSGPSGAFRSSCWRATDFTRREPRIRCCISFYFAFVRFARR